MAKRGTLVIRMIGDTKEFDQANKKTVAGVVKTGKAIDSSLTQPFGKAETAVKGLGTNAESQLRQIDGALGKTGTAVKGLGNDFQTQTRRIDRAMGGTRAEVEQFRKDLKDIKVKVGFDDSEADQGMDGFFSDFKGKAATGGAAAGAIAIAAFMDGLAAEADVDRVAAQLGLSAKQMQRLGEVSGELFADAWADSVGEAAVGVGAVQSSITGMRRAGVKDLEDISKKALAFADLFEVDVNRAAQVAGQSIRSGFADNATQAFDLLFKAEQQVPAAVRDDLLDALDEYGPFLKTLGLDGEQAFGILVEGAKKGMFGIDKAGDALKEFTIRSTDMSTTSKQAYEALGFDAEKMSNKILMGGDTANEAFNKIVTGLLSIENPTKRANTAIKLFGTPIEDLNVSEIPQFLRGLKDGGRELHGFAGTADEAMAQMSDNAQTSFKSLMNGLRQGAQDTIGGLFEGDWSRTWRGLDKIFTTAKTFFKKYWRQIFIISSLGLGLIFVAIVDHWDAIKAKAGDSLDWLGDKIGSALRFFKGLFGDAWRGIASLFRNFIAGITDKFLGFIEFLLEGADKAFGWIPGIGDDLGRTVEDFRRFREQVNNQIRGIDASKSIAIHLIPDDKFQQLVESGAGHPAWTGNRALGGPITKGPPGRDWGSYALMRGEHVWTTSEVSKAGGHQAMFMLRNMAEQGSLRQLIGMAKGGAVETGPIPALVNADKALAQIAATARGIDNLLNQLTMLGKASSFVSAATPSGPMNVSGVVALAKRMNAAHGWDAYWGALYQLVMHESSWNPTAQNPTSSAYGLFQFLDSAWASTGIGKTSDPGLQITAGLRYIASRYGNPGNAWSFWQGHHWYGNGLQGGVFTKPTLIGVGERGPERVDVTPVRAAGGPRRLVIDGKMQITNWDTGEVHMRGVAREELEDEMRHQFGG